MGVRLGLERLAKGELEGSAQPDEGAVGGLAVVQPELAVLVDDEGVLACSQAARGEGGLLTPPSRDGAGLRAPETEWSGIETSLCSEKRPSEAVEWRLKEIQWRSLSVRWLDHDSSMIAGEWIIIACADSGYFALQIGQCVLTALDPSGCIQRCRHCRCTYFTVPVHWHRLSSGLPWHPDS
mgnify:CR=1 FL=1